MQLIGTKQQSANICGFLPVENSKSACKPGSVLQSSGNHSSRPTIAHRFKQSTRLPCGPHKMETYLILLRVEFTLPFLLLKTRCALTAPFHPYRKQVPAVFFLLHWS